MLMKTKSGTIINKNGIEYNEYPPPQKLVKAMERKWAKKLVNNGSLRMRKLEYYQNWENKSLGDPNDGKGMYKLNNHPMEVSSSNDVYIWCSSLHEIKTEQLKILAESGNYDCKVIINNPSEFFKRVKKQLSRGFPIHCGLVNYNRGKDIDKETLNSQKFHFNVFQKDPSFKDDKEYRMSVINSIRNRLEYDTLDLSLVDCSDIMSIESLQK